MRREGGIKERKEGRNPVWKKFLIPKREKCEAREMQKRGMEKINIINRAVSEGKKDSYDGKRVIRKRRRKKALKTKLQY